MRTLTADAQTPDMARRIQRKIFLGGITGLVTSIRKASQKAETAILQAADRKWFQDNPEDEPPAEFPSANDSPLAELETIKSTLLRELNDAIEKSHLFD